MFLTPSCFNDVHFVKNAWESLGDWKHDASRRFVALTAWDIIGLIAISPFQVFPTRWITRSNFLYNLSLYRFVNIDGFFFLFFLVPSSIVKKMTQRSSSNPFVKTKKQTICNVIAYKFYTIESNVRIKSIYTRLLNSLHIFFRKRLRLEAKNLIKLIFPFIGCYICHDK